MSSKLTSADPPATIRSGAELELTVCYDSTTGGSLELSVDDGFAIAPARLALSASSPGAAPVKVTITRRTATTRHCTLSLRFGSALDYLIEVT